MSLASGIAELAKEEDVGGIVDMLLERVVDMMILGASEEVDVVLLDAVDVLTGYVFGSCVDG